LHGNRVVATTVLQYRAIILTVWLLLISLARMTVTGQINVHTNHKLRDSLVLLLLLLLLLIIIIMRRRPCSDKQIEDPSFLRCKI